MADYYDEYVASTRYKRFTPKDETDFFRRLFRGRRKILDLGCGTGRTIRLLRKYGYNFVGIDMSKEMLCVAKRHKIGRYVLSAMPYLPFRNSVFDAAFSLHGGFSHFKTYEERLHACQEASRVTRPGGLVFIDVPNPYRRDKGQTYIVEWPAGEKKIKTIGYAFWPKDLQDILRETHLELKYLLGDYGLEKGYTQESRRLIAIASKK
jgi:SAM-dependent methyltransferase